MKRKLTRAEKKEIAAVIQAAKGDGKPRTAQQTIPYLSLIHILKVPLTEVQEDLKKLWDIRYWVRKATPGTEESKEPPKKLSLIHI